ADGTRRCPRSSKNDRKDSRIAFVSTRLSVSPALRPPGCPRGRGRRSRRGARAPSPPSRAAPRRSIPRRACRARAAPLWPPGRGSPARLSSPASWSSATPSRRRWLPPPGRARPRTSASLLLRTSEPARRLPQPRPQADQLDQGVRRRLFHQTRDLLDPLHDVAGSLEHAVDAIELAVAALHGSLHLVQQRHRLLTDPVDEE